MKGPEKKKGGNKHMRSARTKRKYSPYTMVKRRERNKIKRLRRHLSLHFRHSGAPAHTRDKCASEALKTAAAVFEPGVRKALLAKPLARI